MLHTQFLHGIHRIKWNGLQHRFINKMKTFCFLKTRIIITYLYNEKQKHNETQIQHKQFCNKKHCEIMWMNYFFHKKFEMKQVFIYWYSQSIWRWNLTVFSGKVDKWSNASLTLQKTVNYTVYTKHCYRSSRSSCSSNNWNDDNNAQHQVHLCKFTLHTYNFL